MLCWYKNEFNQKYEIQNRICRTPFSKIYECTLKTNPTELFIVKQQNPLRTKINVKNEMMILKKLQNVSYVVPLLFYEIQFCSSSLVFPKINGYPLHTFLRHKLNQYSHVKQLKLKLTNQLLEGFSAIQQYNIIHRDIKSDNIMIELQHNEPRIKIIDFGLAKQLPSLEALIHNEPCGVYQYMCPEMLRNSVYHGSCDTWSLGVLLYVMHMSKYPYCLNIKRLQEYMMFHIEASKMIPKIDLDVLPPYAKQVVSQMFILDYQKRPMIKDIVFHFDT